jgi:hypothetical protein
MGAVVADRISPTTERISSMKTRRWVASRLSMLRTETPTAPGAKSRMAAWMAGPIAASSSGQRSRMRDSCAGAIAAAT